MPPSSVQIKTNVISDPHFIAVFPNQTKIQTLCGRTGFGVLQGNDLIHLPYQYQLITKHEFFFKEKLVTNGKPILLRKLQIPI